MAWANTPARAFRITRGEPAGFASSDRWVRFFCAACGCPVFGREPSPPADGSDRVCFPVLGLERPERVRPTAHIWCSSQPPWLETRDDLPRFPEGVLTHPRTRSSWRPTSGEVDS